MSRPRHRGGFPQPARRWRGAGRRSSRGPGTAAGIRSSRGRLRRWRRVWPGRIARAVTTAAQERNEGDGGRDPLGASEEERQHGPDAGDEQEGEEAHWAPVRAGRAGARRVRAARGPAPDPRTYTRQCRPPGPPRRGPPARRPARPASPRSRAARRRRACRRARPGPEAAASISSSKPVPTRMTSRPVTTGVNANAASANPAALARAGPPAGAPRPCAAKPTTAAAAATRISAGQPMREPSVGLGRRVASLRVAGDDPQQVGGKDRADEPGGQTKGRGQGIGQERRCRPGSRRVPAARSGCPARRRRRRPRRRPRARRSPGGGSSRRHRAQGAAAAASE